MRDVLSDGATAKCLPWWMNVEPMFLSTTVNPLPCDKFLKKTMIRKKTLTLKLGIWRTKDKGKNRWHELNVFLTQTKWYHQQYALFPDLRRGYTLKEVKLPKLAKEEEGTLVAEVEARRSSKWRRAISKSEADNPKTSVAEETIGDEDDGSTVSERWARALAPRPLDSRLDHQREFCAASNKSLVCGEVDDSSHSKDYLSQRKDENHESHGRHRERVQKPRPNNQ
ncbi:hypothetical protein HYC85_028870 [Camellia sinensis]|uniref:Uncharacterized protein n=1 Tax=Camellia sinensis TaxID=4442 RepID=A0A7J7FWL9_CAMSI|nr:hypothetical protein HYC85_028870 [Camellia sinensis]